MADGDGSAESFLRRLLQSVIGPFAPLATQGLSTVARWIFSQGPAALRALAVTFLAIFIASTVWFWYGFSGMQNTFLEGIAARLDDPNQNFPGLEALLLSSVRSEDLNKSTTVLHVSDEFINSLTLFKEHVRDAASAFEKTSISTGSADFATCPSSIPTCTEFEVHTVNTNGHPASITDKYFVSAQSEGNDAAGFLFVPAMLVPTNDVPDDIPDDGLKAAFLRSRYLRRDLIISDKIAKDVCAMTQTDIFTSNSDELVGKQPIQVYFITSRGIMRICEGRIHNQREYYIDQFSATSFFPSRTYFKKTLAKGDPNLTAQSSDENRTLDKVFTLTAPYIDLGGNGFVTSACTAVSTSNGVLDSVLCFDLPLRPSDVSTAIARNIKVLGGTTPAEVVCSSSPTVNCSPSEPWTVGIIERINELNSTQTLSDLFGKIQVIGQTGTSLGFTVPVAQTYRDRERSATFLYCSIDVAKVKWWNLVRGACVGGSFLGFLACVILMVGDYGARVQEQERSFATFTGVISEAKLSYSRVDGEDRFIDFNEAFVCNLLGYPSYGEAKQDLTNKAFKDFLADEESKRTYEDIERKRRNGISGGRYQVNLRTLDERIIPVYIFGAAVPRPMQAKGKIPETFGILLRAPANNKVTPISERPSEKKGAGRPHQP